MMGEVGDGLNVENASWSFKGSEVAEAFDQHVKRSVPYYDDCHRLVCSISDFFMKEDSVCYELGSATGELSLKLAEHNRSNQQARFVGVDCEQSMVLSAKKKLVESKLKSLEFVQGNILLHEYEMSDLMVAYYTVQFVRPKDRQGLINRIYDKLHWGGGFLLFEKVRACDARFQDMMMHLYNDYKLASGYSSEEIFTKHRSLKGVLEPFSTQGNIDLLKRAGFVDIVTVFKYTCFEGFLAIK